jgi:hypothetical protein
LTTLPPPLRDDAVRADEGDPDHEVAERSVSRPPRAESVRRDEAADRPPFRERRVQREALAVGRDRALQGAEREAGLHDDDLVGGRVLDDAVEAFRPEDGVERARRPSETERRSAADEADACGTRAPSPRGRRPLPRRSRV